MNRHGTHMSDLEEALGPVLDGRPEGKMRPHVLLPLAPEPRSLHHLLRGIVQRLVCISYELLLRGNEAALVVERCANVSKVDRLGLGSLC